MDRSPESGVSLPLTADDKKTRHGPERAENQRGTFICLELKMLNNHCWDQFPLLVLCNKNTKMCTKSSKNVHHRTLIRPTLVKAEFKCLLEPEDLELRPFSSCLCIMSRQMCDVHCDNFQSSDLPRMDHRILL